MWKKISNNSHWLLIATLQLILILLCVGRLNDEELLRFYFNTDCLYLPSLFTDVFVDGNSSRGWSLTPAPYFFPDMPLYFFIYAIVGNISFTIVIYFFIQLLLIEIFFYKILFLIVENEAKAKNILILGCFSLQIFLLAGAVGKEPFIAQLLLNTASHLGAVLLSLITFFLVFSYLVKNEKRYLVLAALFIIISIVSDRIFIVQTVIPLFVLAFYFSIKRKDYFLFAYIVGGAAVGWLSFKFIHSYVIYIPYEPIPPYSLGQSIGNFIGGFKFILRHFPFGGFILFFHLGTLILSPFLTFFIKREVRVMYLSLMLSATLAFIFPILFGFINAIDTFRYLMQSYVLCLLFAPLIIAFLLNQKKLKILVIFISIGYSGFVGGWAIFNLKREGLINFLNFKPSYVSTPVENDNRLRNGISDYWSSKQFYQFGNRDFRVVAVHNYSEAFVWQANKCWFIGSKNSKPPVFNFSFDLRVDKIMGLPKDSLVVPNHHLYIYDDFIFKEDADGKIRIYPAKE